MVASNASGTIMKDIKTQFKGGDIKVIHDFISSIANKINLRVTDHWQISNQMKINCKNII